MYLRPPWLEYAVTRMFTPIEGAEEAEEGSEAAEGGGGCSAAAVAAGGASAAGARPERGRMIGQGAGELFGVVGILHFSFEFPTQFDGIA